jgi:myosin-crossreactive antigen
MSIKMDHMLKDVALIKDARIEIGSYRTNFDGPSEAKYQVFEKSGDKVLDTKKCTVSKETDKKIRDLIENDLLSQTGFKDGVKC